MIVEVWGLLTEGCPSLLLSSHFGDWWVENGCYVVKTNKDKNQIFIPYTNETHECYYLGDVNYTGDYNETMQNYAETKQILGKNLIKNKPNNQELPEDDEPHF